MLKRTHSAHVKRIGFAVLFLAVTCAWGQPPDTLWTWTNSASSSNAGYDIRQTLDGGFVIAGDIDTSGGYDPYLIRMFPDGETIWTRDYPELGAINAQTVHVLPNGDLLFAGIGSDAFVVRSDSSGEPIWSRLIDFGVGFGNSIDTTADGGSIFAVRGGFPGADILLVRMNGEGDTLWTRRYGEHNLHFLGEVKSTSDSGFIVVGSALVPPLGLQYYLIRTTNQGDTIWTRTYGGPDSEWGKSVCQCHDGGFVMAGYIELLDGSGDRDMLVVRTNWFGDPEWAKTYGMAAYEGAASIEQTSDGGYIIGGWSNAGGTGLDAYMLKLDIDGDSIWSWRSNRAGSDGGSVARQVADNGFVLVGSAHSSEFGVSETYVARFSHELDVDAYDLSKPVTLRLHQNFPNPFNSSTTLSFELAQTSPVEVVMYDVLGRMVRAQAFGVMQAGQHQVGISAGDLASGSYWVRLQANRANEVRKVVVVR